MVDVFTIVGTSDYVVKRLAELQELADVLWVGGPVYYLPYDQIRTYRQRLFELVAGLTGK